MQMRMKIIFGLITIPTILFGQTKKELFGKYEYSIFMYSYSLTLNDSSKYETIESSDLGSERTVGTWTIRGQAVRLAPRIKFKRDAATQKREEEKITTITEQAVVIESRNVLILKREQATLN
jgi:hypothetical protein